MSFYRQSIILFGIVVPLILALAVIAAGYVVKSKMTESFALKRQNFLTHQQARSQAVAVEKEVKSRRPHLERWNKDLAQETASVVGNHLRAIAEKLPNKEIQQTAFDPSSSKSGFGSASAQDSSRIRISFRGTFRTLQRAFLELETRMPQLTLEDLSIEPATNSPYQVTMQVTYTAWEN